MDKWLKNLEKKASRDTAKENCIAKNNLRDLNVEKGQITGLFENKRMFRAWGYVTFILSFVFVFSFFVFIANQQRINEDFERLPKYYNLRGSYSNDRESNPYILLFISSIILFATSATCLILVRIKSTSVTITSLGKSFSLRIEGAFFKTHEMTIEKVRSYQLMEHQWMYYTPVYLALCLETDKGEYVLGELIPDSRNYGLPQYDAGELAIQLQSVEDEKVYSMAKFLGLL